MEPKLTEVIHFIFIKLVLLEFVIDGDHNHDTDYTLSQSASADRFPLMISQKIISATNDKKRLSRDSFFIQKNEGLV
jgi:hypothetical protein